MAIMELLNADRMVSTAQPYLLRAGTHSCCPPHLPVCASSSSFSSFQTSTLQKKTNCMPSTRLYHTLTLLPWQRLQDPFIKASSLASAWAL